MTFFTKTTKQCELKQSVQLKDNTFEFAYEINLATDAIEWYGNIADRLGYPRSEFPKTLSAWVTIIHPEDGRAVRDKMCRHLKDQDPYYEIYRVLRKDGEFIYITDFGTALQHQSGSPSKWVGLMRISESPAP
jgi:PAS domain S-box-containing protein